MVTNSSINLPTAASGKLVQAQGIGVANNFTTATYPSTAGTIGNTLTSDGTNWISAPASGGALVKQVRAITNTASAPTAIIPLDGTIPQIGEGTQLFSLAITPASASNILVFQATIQCTSDAGTPTIIAMFQGATANALCAIDGGGSGSFSTDMSTAILTYSMTAGTTSSTTFQIRVGPGMSGTSYINRDGASATPLGAAMINSTFTISEYTT